MKHFCACVEDKHRTYPSNTKIGGWQMERVPTSTVECALFEVASREHTHYIGYIKGYLSQYRPLDNQISVRKASHDSARTATADILVRINWNDDNIRRVISGQSRSCELQGIIRRDNYKNSIIFLHTNTYIQHILESRSHMHSSICIVVVQHCHGDFHSSWSFFGVCRFLLFLSHDFCISE